MTWASFAPADFRFTAGEVTTVIWAGGQRTFCPRCGTPLTFAAAAVADELDVTVGSLDHPETVAPQNHTWIEDRMPWVRLADGLPAHARARPDHSPAGGDLPPGQTWLSP